MSDCIILIEKSSNLIDVTLYNNAKLPVTDAVVTLTIVDQNQEQVAGVGFPQTLVSQGAGVYLVTLPGSLQVVRNESYWAQITSASPSAGDLYQEVLCKCTVLRS